MPKIRIVEKDMTSALPSSASENIIFLVDSGIADLTLIESETKIPSGSAKKSIIKKILHYGGKVLACSSYANAAPYLKDRNQFDVKFLLVDEGTVTEDSGTIESIDVADLTSALEIAVKRKDVAIIYGKNTQEYVDAEKNLFKTEMTSTDSFVNSEYRKWEGKFVLPFTAKSLVMENNESVAEAAILSYLRMVSNGNAEWLAFAGSKRGSIPGAESCGFLTEDEIDDLQPSSGTSTNPSYALNPICNVNPWGIRIWGSRTAMPLGLDENTSGLVAQSFANIRVLICDLKKKLYQSAREFQFEPDNDVLWVNFTSKVNVLLEEMKQSYGIAGYKWIREETSDRAKVKAKLRIIPIEPVEDFDITLELADSIEVTE